MKLTNNETKVANVLAKGIVIILAIFFYFIRLIFKSLYRLKRFLFRLAIVIFIFYNAYTVLHLVVYAPYSNASEFRRVEKPLTEKEQIINYVIDRFGKDSQDALKVFKCESGLRPDAVGHNTNGSSDYGIAQINSIHSVPGRFLLDWRTNIDIAYKIFSEQGWTPWTCRKVLE